MDKTGNVLFNILNAAENKDYSGYSKFDALNSPFLKALSCNNKWMRFALTQIIKEIPINLRPLFGVRPSRNPKGIGLFSRAYFFFYQVTGNEEYLKKGEALIQWLLNNSSPEQFHLCWGYNFVWQNTLFLQDRFEPNAVVTVFVGEALLHAYQLTKKDEYLEAARSVAEFIIKDLPVIYEQGDERAIAYVLRRVDAAVLNNQVLTGAFLAKVWRHTNEKYLLEIAIRQINYTVNRRTKYYAWYYTHPKEKSPITHDNYHTGGVLDGLLEFFEQTGDDRYLEIYWKGLEFYKENLFQSSGAPRWMNNKQYPYDVHGAAQGIISFAKAARHQAMFLKEAESIADWTITHLYRRDTGDFAYRKGRWVKWNYSLMRWCNAWMAKALAELEMVKEIKPCS